MVPAQRTPLILALALAVGTMPLIGCDRTAGREGVPRHVVLISLDTLRADQLGFYGNPTVQTPNLDRLAGESIVFDDLMVAAPTTLASHASLFTGRYPQRHGTPRNGFVVHPDNVTLAEILRDEGFATAGFAASFALASRFGIDQGFEHWDERFERLKGEDGSLQNERSAAAVTDAALGWIDDAGLDGRLFLFAHYFDAHAPYAAPAPYDTMYDPAGREGLPDWFTLRRSCPATVGRETELTKRTVLQYAGELSYLDEQLGRLVDGLRERGILDDALLVITSDHGENFWEHPACFDHGWTAFQTTIRGVGLARLPGAVNAGARVPTLISGVDLLPTILERLGLSAAAEIDGEAFDLATLRAPESEPVRFAQATKPWAEVETDPLWRNLLKTRAVRRGHYKMIQTPYLGSEALFDLEADPGERRNLLGTGSAEAESIAAELRPTLERWAASADPLPSELATDHQQETIDRLKSLGYLGEP